MKIKLLVSSVLLGTLFACNAQNSTKKMAQMEKMNTSNMEKEHTININKGELFLAVVGYQMQEKETLLQEYFGIVFPPAQKHGFTPLGQLPIDKVVSGDFMPNEFVGLFKWPGMESVQGFMGEIDPARLTELRLEIWTELKQHMIVFKEDTSITFKENKTYEVKMIWNDTMLDTQKIYKNGGTILVNSPIAGYEDLGKNKAPNTLMIIEWPNQKTADSFRKKKSLKSQNEEAFYTHFAFPEMK